MKRKFRCEKSQKSLSFITWLYSTLSSGTSWDLCQVFELILSCKATYYYMVGVRLFSLPLEFGLWRLSWMLARTLLWLFYSTLHEVRVTFFMFWYLCTMPRRPTRSLPRWNPVPHRLPPPLGHPFTRPLALPIPPLPHSVRKGQRTTSQRRHRPVMVVMATRRRHLVSWEITSR